MTPTRAFLFAGLACHALAQAPALPPRFEIPAGTPAVAKPVQPAKFLESVGRRAALLGREDGTFEAWTMPVKVLRDFRLSAWFNGALEPVPLPGFAERVTVSPGRVTIVHSHAAFTIRETWLASIDAPVAAVLLDIVSYKIREGVEWIPDIAVAETGDKSKAVRLLGTECSQGRVTFQFAGPAGTDFRPRFWYGHRQREGNAGAVRSPSNEGFTKVSIGFLNKSPI